MNKDIKKKWINALRSGKYKQGSGWLLEDNKYCCLGVLSDILHSPKKTILGVEMPTVNVCKKAGISYTKDLNNPSRVQGDGDGDNDAYKLAGFNDGGKSFKWIASWIEKKL